MQMKELLQSLVDDGLVKAEKCGITVVYWSFEYDVIKAVKDQIGRVEEKIDKTEDRLKVLRKEINQEKVKRVKKNVIQRVKEWEELKKSCDELEKTLGNSTYDGDRVSEIKRELQHLVANAEICTDNMEAMMYHFKKQNDIGREVFKQELGIPEEFTDLPDLNTLFKEFETN
ncbi:Meiotic nuclear division protein 1 [Cyberlindnera fabianii]|uniref:Meiotic nuclear division protein 1 n=1 Tax=Cyberlindnera fabianii TaxID=36022 RepID=A0A1V2LDV8_CYBFA|nr:Meiotic nuclear division protein 1 [Cyberlindnera fabianii]